MSDADPWIDVVIEDPRWGAVGLDAVAEAAAGAALRHLGRDPRAFEVVVLGCDDARIGALNAASRGIERPTNVLAWPSAARDPAHPPEDGPLGDVALSYDTCAAEALAQGKGLGDHATHLVAHAVLHLLGFDHDDDIAASLMEGHERTILRGMGLPIPTPPTTPRAAALSPAPLRAAPLGIPFRDDAGSDGRARRRSAGGPRSAAPRAPLAPP